MSPIVRCEIPTSSDVVCMKLTMPIDSLPEAMERLEYAKKVRVTNPELEPVIEEQVRIIIAFINANRKAFAVMKDRQLLISLIAAFNVEPSTVDFIRNVNAFLETVQI